MVRKEVSFVLRLIDDFNAKDIVGLAQSFFIKSLPVKPLHKPEGYYVFVNCDIKDDLIIETVNYKTRILPIEVIKNNKDNEVIIVRLYRKTLGVFNDCRWVEGNNSPDKFVYIPYREVAGLSFQKAVVKDGKTVMHLSGYSIENLLGGCYTLTDNKNAQLFYIIGKTSDGGYEITDANLRSQQSKQRLVRVYSDYCDKEGNFSIPVEPSELKTVGKVSTLKVHKKEWGCYFE